MPFVKEALALFPSFPSDQKLRVYDPAAGDGRLLEAFRELYPNFDYCFSEIIPSRYLECKKKGLKRLSLNMYDLFYNFPYREGMDIVFTNLPFFEDGEEKNMFHQTWNWLLKPGGWMAVFLNPELKEDYAFSQWIKGLRNLSSESAPYELNFTPLCENSEGDCTKPLWFVLLHKVR